MDIESHSSQMNNFENNNNNNNNNNHFQSEMNERQKDESDSYSFRSVRLWCHNCCKEYKRLISSVPQEILCSNCNFALEIIENGQEHPSSFNAYESQQHQRQQQQRQQQQQQYQRQQQQEQQQRQQQQQQRQNPYYFQQFVFPGNNIFFNVFGNEQEEQQNQQQPFANVFEQLFNVFSQQQQNSDPRHQPASQDKINKLNQVIVQCDDNQNQCPICYENYKKGEVMNQLPCSHNFHQGCVKEWLNKHNSCPMCRKQI